MSPWGSALGAVTLMGSKALHSLKGGRREEAEKYYRVLDKAQKMPETCWKDFFHPPEVSRSQLHALPLERQRCEVDAPMHVSVCPSGCFPDPDMDLDLGEILLNQFNCKSISWMGLKLYPVLILSEDVPALNAPPGPFVLP